MTSVYSVLGWWCVAAVLLVAVVVRASSGSTVRCDKSQPCEVPYKGIIALLVTKKSNGLWRKMEHSAPNVTADPIVCNLTDSVYDCPINNGISLQLTNQNTGMYYYNYTVRDVEKYEFRNVTILAPPTLTNCPIPDSEHTCIYPLVVVSNVPVTITVSWEGVGPFSVTWTHNGTAYSCTEDPLCKPSHTANSMSIVLTLYSIANPDKLMAQAGFYRANVSNSFGWNESSTEAMFQCPPMTDRVQSFTKDAYLEQYSGEPFSFQCEVHIGSGAYLYLCYVRPNETLSELNPKQDCASCVSNEAGSCYNFEHYPQINVSSDYHSCFNHAYVNFSIASLTNDDSGIFHCGWIDGTQAAIDYYANVSLSVSPRPVLSSSGKLSLIIALPLGFVVLVLVVIVIGGAFYKRRHLMVVEEEEEEGEGEEGEGEAVNGDGGEGGDGGDGGERRADRPRGGRWDRRRRAVERRTDIIDRTASPLLRGPPPQSYQAIDRDGGGGVSGTDCASVLATTDTERQPLMDRSDSSDDGSIQESVSLFTSNVTTMPV